MYQDLLKLINSIQSDWQTLDTARAIIQADYNKTITQDEYMKLCEKLTVRLGLYQTSDTRVRPEL